MTYTNPVISGFYPDPSVCRVGDTYYLVCSSFQFFPGVPLFESKDLVNWEQIGHVLTRESQLPLGGTDSCSGIYAPTIRYNNGRFYMVTTNTTTGGNFYVYTDDIHGEWSDPIFVEQDGIDPSLYFEDGKAYFMSNGTDTDGRSGIFQCEIDISNGKKLSEAKCIWHGTGGRFLESPHLYKIKGKYYLMAAEGGTEYGHMIVYATGDSLYGPFVEAPHNPLLTNRNLGGHVIQGCGHGDLVEDESGNIWMLHLGFRQIGEWVMHHITGREVYLVPVTMDEKGYLSAGTDGTTRKTVTTPLIDTVQKPWEKYTFENTKPCREWIFIQNPNFENYDFSKDCLVLTSNSVSLSDSDGSPTFTAVRQKELNFSLSCEIQSEGCEAGISLYLTAEQHYDFGIRKSSDGNGYELFRRLKIGDITHEDNIIPLPESTAKATFEIAGSNFAYMFWSECDGQSYEMGSAQTKYLSSEIAGNFTGVVIGLYAYNTPDEQPSKAVFTDLSVVSGEWVSD